MTELVFNLICFIHVIIWAFVLVAFVDNSTASFNLFYVVPFIYLLHILPFHILIETKKKMNPETWEEKDNAVKSTLILPELFDRLQKFLDHKCFMSPLSAQGMLIFGAITSAWKLKN